MSDKIVVGTDGSETAGRALNEAVRLAKALDAELHVVTAYKPLRGAKISGAPEGAAKVWAPLPDSQAQAVIDEAASRVRMSGLEPKIHMLDRDPGDALLEVADEVGATMIVVGNRGMSGAGRVLGSVPNKVSHAAHCNVMIVSTGKGRAGSA
ncbi:MAG TPA: universal stress protein [Solirubrobacteraceae bacterium]|nr:universal stress protein [Solirubrobacteraceae bacterium]